MIDVAPTTSKVRSCLLPHLEILPSYSLPPEEFDFGVRPSQAAKSLPLRKPAGSATNAFIVPALISTAAVRWRMCSRMKPPRRSWNSGSAVVIIEVPILNDGPNFLCLKQGR